MTFSKTAEDGLARAGVYSTAHGDFETPNFMPVGTRATVKGVDVERLREAGTQITLVNTYHLWERPGEELIHRLGGIHSFCGWDGPILSDSGGYQVFSLQKIRDVKEEGVTFQSHLDGRKLFLSPEKAMRVQETLGVDIAMVLDECPPPEWGERQIAESLDRTVRWAKRAISARERPKTQLFGITQGGGVREQRTRAAELLGELAFDGLAIGGLSVGEPKEVMYEVLSYHPSQLPGEKLRYLMGVGTPEDIVEAVHNGVDLFDCVMPTRSGRFGRAFVRGDGPPFVNVRNSSFKADG
ncbi:MAG: tRNA guanosine(34) transglycosylase Tgt, partial [Bdellovibrionales bacterium]|nr:tRNA guanosine(34) transglycosylase Tgt [Bdellovibrionales bacterium]